MPTLEIIYGDITNPTLIRGLLSTVRVLNPTGTFYLGYPVLASADSRINVDAMLITKEHGLVAFLFGHLPTGTAEVDWKALVREQDELYGTLESYLGRHSSLREGRRLAFEITTVTILPRKPRSDVLQTADGYYVELEELVGVLKGLPGIPEQVYRNIEAAVNKVSTIRPVKKRSNVRRNDSRGAKLKRIEKEIANLDRWQKRSAIEVPDGVQRIRGLAGSGKTVVLALKAAYLHAQHPEWNIALTFYSRSLYQQLVDLTRRFSFEHILDEPDWTKLQILHAWGSMRGRQGIYTTLAMHLGATIRDWGTAKALFGASDAFAGICRELLDAARARKSAVEPLFDAVLIDEAQDLPQEFFELIAMFTHPPHRIAFAYDELQQLNAAQVPSVEELFGMTATGKPRLSLEDAGHARNDVVLPVCYRNPPWTLTVAHALGFGVYRKGGLVQHFDMASLWTEVGYRINAGSLVDGKKVTLSRDPSFYPSFFIEQLSPSDAVQFYAFSEDRAQLSWLAKSIRANLDNDEIDTDDILIVLPNTYTSKRRALALVRALSAYGISAHHVGATSSQDRMFDEGSVAITHIHRAKGNEAAMVYVIDGEYAIGDPDWTTSIGLASRRNVLFTAITRARAWVRVAGVGPKMEDLKAEFDKVAEKDFQLSFKIPTESERRQLRQLHRDRSESEISRKRDTIRSFEAAVEALERDDVLLDDLPEGLLQRLPRSSRNA